MFMPSEIARLVLGYLKDAGCTRAVTVYLTENAHLSEYVACLKQGRAYPTTIAGQSLTDILQEYCQLKAAERMPGLSSQVSTEKSSEQSMLLGIAREQADALDDASGHNEKGSTNVCLISTATNTDDLIESRQIDLPQQIPVQRKIMVDSSTQCSEGPLLNHGEASVASLRADDITDSPSLASTSSSTQTPNRYPLRSWSSTPNRRQVDFYSSPSSMVKSAMMYNFGVETFRTPAKDRCLADTPLKDRYLDEDSTWKSPRRKNQVPRKRLSYTPLSALKTGVNIDTNPDESESQSNDNADITIILNTLLHNTALHEKIADNINKVVNHTTHATIANNSPARKQSSCAANENVHSQELPDTLARDQNAQVPTHHPSQVTCDDQMIEAVMKYIESDSLVEASLNMFFDKHEGNSHDSQMLGACSDYAASPDTHGTPLSAAESNVPSSVAGTLMSENANTPQTVIMSPCGDVIQEPPDSSGIMVAAYSNDDHCYTPVSEIPSHCPSSSDQNMESPYQNITSSPRDVPSEPLQAVSSQSDTDSQIAKNLPLRSGVNTTQSSVQLPAASVLQNVVQLQYMNAPSMPCVPGSTQPYFSSVVPTINQSKLPTIWIGPMMTSLNPVQAPSALPACASLQKENSCPAPVQYFQLNSTNVMAQSNSKSFTHFKFGPFHESQPTSAPTVRTTSQNNLQKKTKSLACKQIKNVRENAATPCQVPQPCSYVEVLPDILNHPVNSSNQDCSSNLSELLCLTSSDPAITLYSQDMQGHRVDNLSFLKRISNTSISVSGQLLNLTPHKSSSAVQFITLSPDALNPVANATSAPPKPQSLDERTNCSKPAEKRSSSSSQRTNALHTKPTKCKTGNGKAAGTRNAITVGNQRRKVISKPLDFGGHLPAQKPVRKKQMLMLDRELNASTIENGNQTTHQQHHSNVENIKSADFRVIAPSTENARSMPALDNLRIITTTRTSRGIGSSEKSPQLTSLIQSASLLKTAHRVQGGEQTVSHVRALDFSGPSNLAGKKNSQKETQQNVQIHNSESKSKDANISNKTNAKPKVAKGTVKNSEITSKRNVKARSVNGPCRKGTQLAQSESIKSCIQSNGKAKTIAEVASASPCTKKRTARQANLSQKIQTPAKKSKGTVPGKVLSVMDIERFLSGLHYEQE